MGKLLITKQRGGLWARLTAFMVVLMMTTAQMNAQVAEIVGGETYSTVQAAVDAATADQTVKMLANSTENVSVASGKDITLDLNGKVITAMSTSATAITNNGTLTLTDNVGGGNVTGGDKGIEQNGTLTLAGMVNITENTANLYLPEGKTVSVSALTTGTNIGVTTASTYDIIPVTAFSDADYSSFFTSDNVAYQVKHILTSDNDHRVVLVKSIYELVDYIELDCKQYQNFKLPYYLPSTTTNYSWEITLSDIAKNHSSCGSFLGIYDHSSKRSGYFYSPNAMEGGQSYFQVCVGSSHLGTKFFLFNKPKNTIHADYTSTGSGGTYSTYDKLGYVASKENPSAGNWTGYYASGSSNQFGITSCATYNQISSSSEFLSMKLYDVRIWEGATPKIDAIMVKKNNVAGLYDMVTGQFIEPVGYDNLHTMTFDQQDATTPGTLSIKVATGMPMTNITVPEKTNYAFDGYYEQTGGQGKKYYNFDGTPACNYDKSSDITVYASWKTPVAMIGEKGYASVQNAVTAATNGQTVQLLQNTDLTAVLDIVNGKNFTLDLNGYRLRQTAENTRVMNVNSGATLTITDSRPDGETHYFTVGTTHVGSDMTNPVQQWTLNTEATSGTDWKALTARPETNDIIAVKGGIITGGYANNNNYGGCIYNNGTVNINAGIIVGNTAKECGGGIFSNNGITNICGTAALIGNTANQGGASYNSWSTTFTMTDNSRVSFNTTRHEGGGVWARRVATFSGNSEISYNQTVINGGNGGGVFAFSNDGHFTFSENVLIKNNSAWNGGGICFSGNELSINSGTIINNSCRNQGGGVYCGDVNMTIGGTTIITGNKKGSADNNLYLTVNKTVTRIVTASSLTEGANIGITSENVPTIGNPVAVTTNNSESVMQYFTSDNGSFFVIEDDNKAVQLAVPVAQIVGGEKFTTVQAAINAAEDGQTVQMLNTTTESVTFTKDKAVTLDLNGNNLEKKSGTNAITVSNGSLTIKDDTETAGGVNGGISKDNSSTVKIEGGKYSFDPTPFLDKYHAAKPTGTQPYIYEVVSDPDLIVCNDGTHSFTSLQQAIVFNMTATIELSKDIEENIEIAIDQDIILDLKGKTITSKSGGTVITNNGTLTVIDSSDGNGTITGATTNYAKGIYNEGTLNLYAGNVTGNAAGVLDNNTLTVGGKAVISLNGPAEGRMDLCLPDNTTFLIATDTYAPTTMHIGITTQTAPQSDKDIPLTDANEDYLGYSKHFFGDNSAYTVFYNDTDKKLYLTNDVKIIISAEPVEGGEVAIKYTSGSYMTPEEAKHILYGTSVTIEATAFNESGFAFAGWFNKATGEYFSKTQKFTFDAKENLELEARFTDQVIWVRVKKGN